MEWARAQRDSDQPVSGTVMVRVQALDENQPFDTVTLFLDGEPYQSSAPPASRFEFHAQRLTPGRHLLWVEAFRGATRVGRSRRVAIIVTAPEATPSRRGPVTLRLTFSTVAPPVVRAEPPQFRHPLRDRPLPRPRRRPRREPAQTAGKSRPTPTITAPSTTRTTSPPRLPVRPPVGKAQPTPAPVAKAQPTPAPVAKAQPTPAPGAKAQPTPASGAKAQPTPLPVAKALPAPVPRPSAKVAQPPAMVRRAPPPPRTAATVPALGLLPRSRLLPVTLLVLAVALALATFTVMAALIMRARMFTVVGKRRQFLATWRPLLLESIADERAHDPASVLRRRMAIRAAHQGNADWVTFLHLWNHLHESQRERSRPRLNEVGQMLGVAQVAAGMLQGEDTLTRLMAIATLGNLGEYSSFDALRAIAESGEPQLSLAAARALIHLDPMGATHALMPLIAARTDWAPAKVASILREAGSGVEMGTAIVSAPLSEATLGAERAHVPRLIRILTTTECDSALPTVRAILERAPDDACLAPACLQALTDDPQDRATLRRYLAHANLQLRLEAIVALARTGDATDPARFVELLKDEEWWIRFQAARALKQMPAAMSSLSPITGNEPPNPPVPAGRDEILAETS